MNIKKFLIADGNPTALIWKAPPNKKRAVVKRCLREVEQVGFVGKYKGINRLSMMGNELCINATMALASSLGEEGTLLTSGLPEVVTYSNEKGLTSIEASLNFKREKNIILLNGIGFIYRKSINLQPKNFLIALANKYKLPAFGLITIQNSKLIPYVYVKKTNSLFKETACGSGSIALNILKGFESITQPTDEIIYVKRSGKKFTITAKVNLVVS